MYIKLINMREELVLSKCNSKVTLDFLMDFEILFIYFIAYMIASISTEVNSKDVINCGPNPFQILIQFLMFQEWKLSSGYFISWKFLASLKNKWFSPRKL